MHDSDFKKRYEVAKIKLLSDIAICKENRVLFEKFFEFQENKLKRINNARFLDNSAYKTLYGYTQKFKNINRWFRNKPLTKITRNDIKLVYDGLEDGLIKRKNGQPYENLTDSYYSKVFKSTLFKMAGKLDLAKEIIQYNGRIDKDVRFIREEDFRKIANNIYKPHQKLLFWLAWDIGENINSLLKLRKRDFTRQENPDTKEPEDRVNLKREILKRNRKPRSEITNYPETVEFLDQHLRNLKEDDLLFDFGYPSAKMMIVRAVERSGVKCIPNGEPVTWKDLRSGMACDLLQKGWTTDEVNARLGHKPSSKEIDKYVNFLAIDRHRPKTKVQQFEISKINHELQESKEREKLQIRRIESIQDDYNALKNRFERIEYMLIKSDDVLVNLLKSNPKLLKEISSKTKKYRLDKELEQLIKIS